MFNGGFRALAICTQKQRGTLRTIIVLLKGTPRATRSREREAPLHVDPDLNKQKDMKKNNTSAQLGAWRHSHVPVDLHTRCGRFDFLLLFMLGSSTALLPSALLLFMRRLLPLMYNQMPIAGKAISTIDERIHVLLNMCLYIDESSWLKLSLCHFEQDLG